MTDLTAFFGRFHPLLVHLPIGLIVLLAFFEFISRWPRFRHANSNAGLILGVLVPISIGTVVCGWLLSWSGGYDSRLLQLHMWTGIGTAVACVIAALLYWFDLQKVYRVFLFFTVVTLAISSHFGGSLTHGSDYLVRHAPEPIRALMGLPKRTPSTAPTLAVANIDSNQGAAAEPVKQTAFAAVVAPVLEDKCVGCHGPEKSKGGLRLDSFEALTKGGDNGPVLVSGKSAESELIRRILLPLESEDHMPPEGKPQLKADEIALLQWWIDAGAAADKTIAELKPPPKVARLVQKTLGDSSASPDSSAAAEIKPDTESLPPKPAAELLPVAQKLADELGIPITLLGQNEPWFQCNAAMGGKSFGDDQLAKLEPLGTNLRWLDLAGTAITDAGLERIKGMRNLTRLHLERTGLSDAALVHLADLKQLEYLNLYGTTVTDAGLEHLEALPKLKQVYLWQTKVTPAAGKAFADARIDKDLIKQWESEIDQLKARIREQHMTVEMGLALAAAKPANEAAAAKPINSECPVSGKAINPEKTSKHNDKLVAFCCDDCKAKFDSDPKPFLAKLGLASEAK